VRDPLVRAEPRLAVGNPVLLSARIDEQLADHRLFAHLVALLSALTTVLAAVGLYGVVAYGVADRIREFGISRALGAPAGSIVRLVVRQTVLTVLVGVVFGIAGAAVLARSLVDRLPGVAPLDHGTWILAIGALAAVVAAAGVLPVGSAVRVEPVDALRREVQGLTPPPTGGDTQNAGEVSHC
jgi:putative ABC transport system permease protein